MHQITELHVIASVILAVACFVMGWQARGKKYKRDEKAEELRLAVTDTTDK